MLINTDGWIDVAKFADSYNLTEVEAKKVFILT